MYLMICQHSRGGNRSKMSTVTFMVVLVMFLMDTSICIIDVNNAIREITLTLTSTSSLSLEDRYALTYNLPYAVENALYAFMVGTPTPPSIPIDVSWPVSRAQSNIGDVIIIWRTYAFWHRPHERWLILIPCAFLLGSVGTLLP